MFDKRKSQPPVALIPLQRHFDVFFKLKTEQDLISRFLRRSFTAST